MKIKLNSNCDENDCVIDNGYLFAKDRKRLFINTSLGCSSNCKFCYLPRLGINNIKSRSWEEILELLNSSDYICSKETLITIGCYSECFDKINKEETIKAIKYFLNNGNQVQISTKRYVSYEDIKELIPLIKYYGQFIIFVSSSTISSYKDYELNTEQLELRFKTFDLINYNIPVILYMKPIIQDVTIRDIDLYKKIIIHYDITNVVVGSLFTEEKNQERVHFSLKSHLYYNECADEEKIIEELSQYVKVWRRSTEVTRYLKNKLEKLDSDKR